MTDVNWITIDTAEQRYHVTAEALQTMIEEGNIKHLQKGDSSGFHVYVDRDEISGRFAKRSTASKYKEQTPAAIAGAGAGLVISEIYKAVSSAFKASEDIYKSQVSPVKKRLRVTGHPKADKHFIKELKHVCAASGLTMHDLAGITGISPRTLHDASSPLRGVSILTAQKIVDVLNKFPPSKVVAHQHGLEIVPVAINGSPQNTRFTIENLRQFRENCGISTQELARASDVSMETCRNAELHQKGVNKVIAMKILEVAEEMKTTYQSGASSGNWLPMSLVATEEE